MDKQSNGVSPTAKASFLKRLVMAVFHGMERGTGKTTKQMQEAPQGAVYIWVNSHRAYPTVLSNRLGRSDLQIRSPDWLYPGMRWQGIRTPVVVDHAAELTDKQYESLRHIAARL